MIKPETTKILQSLGISQYGNALQEFLDEQYKIVNDVKACTSWEDTLARKHTVEVLDKLFAFMNKPKPEKVGENRKYE